MTTFLFIRHASHDLLGKGLAGRGPIPLNPQGRIEAEQLAIRLDAVRLDALYSSPRNRTLETAEPLAQRRKLPVNVLEAIDEIDFGDWTERTFTELEPDPQWPLWIQQRSAAQPPGGETIGRVQQRTTEALRLLASQHREETVALVTHGDVIKAAIAHFLGISLDHLEQFEIAPASVERDPSRHGLVAGRAAQRHRPLLDRSLSAARGCVSG